MSDYSHRNIMRIHIFLNGFVQCVCVMTVVNVRPGHYFDQFYGELFSLLWKWKRYIRNFGGAFAKRLLYFCLLFTIPCQLSDILIIMEIQWQLYPSIPHGHCVCSLSSLPGPRPRRSAGYSPSSPWRCGSSDDTSIISLINTVCNMYILQHAYINYTFVENISQINKQRTHLWVTLVKELCRSMGYLLA